MAVEFTHGGKTYSVVFDTKQHRTRNLQKRGILQPRKTQAKRTADPLTRRCTHCTVKDGEKPIANGMAVCSPTDKFDNRTGQKMALRRAISRARQDRTRQLIVDRTLPTAENIVSLDKGLTPVLDRDWAAEAWQALFDSQTINARAARQRAKKQTEKHA